jgi:hypothetical protein
LDLSQFDDDQKSSFEEEFKVQEVKQAIQEANEVSALGPSGQTIAFFKLLFMAIPNTVTGFSEDTAQESGIYSQNSQTCWQVSRARSSSRY